MFFFFWGGFFYCLSYSMYYLLCTALTLFYYSIIIYSLLFISISIFIIFWFFFKKRKDSRPIHFTLKKKGRKFSPIFFSRVVGWGWLGKDTYISCQKKKKKEIRKEKKRGVKKINVISIPIVVLL